MGLQLEAAKLGLSLDPDRCGIACDNVRRLATIELKKTVLRLYAEGKEVPYQRVAQSK